MRRRIRGRTFSTSSSSTTAGLPPTPSRATMDPAALIFRSAGDELTCSAGPASRSSHRCGAYRRGRRAHLGGDALGGGRRAGHRELLPPGAQAPSPTSSSGPTLIEPSGGPGTEPHLGAAARSGHEAHGLVQAHPVLQGAGVDAPDSSPLARQEPRRGRLGRVPAAATGGAGHVGDGCPVLRATGEGIRSWNSITPPAERLPPGVDERCDHVALGPAPSGRWNSADAPPLLAGRPMPMASNISASSLISSAASPGRHAAVRVRRRARPLHQHGQTIVRPGSSRRQSGVSVVHTGPMGDHRRSATIVRSSRVLEHGASILVGDTGRR